MFKKVLGLIAGFLVLMFGITLLEVKVGTKTTAKELEDKVVVYTTYDKDITDTIKSGFEKTTSINVEVTKFSNDADMLKAIKNKKDMLPDIILGASIDTLEELKKDNYLDENKPSWYYDIKDDQKDKDGYWYSMFGSPIVMFYNTSVLKPEEVPQNLLALNDVKHANQIVLPNTDSTDFKYFLNTVIYPYVKENKVDDGFKAISVLKFNVKEYKNPGDQVIEAVSKKEGVIGFADLSKVNAAIKKGDTLAVVYGSEKYPMTADGVAIVKGCANVNAAKLFEEFAAGPKMQYKIAQKLKLNPTNNKVLSLLGGELSELKDRTYQVDNKEFNSNITSWIEKWDAIVKEEIPADHKNNNQNAAGIVHNNEANLGNNAPHSNGENVNKQPANTTQNNVGTGAHNNAPATNNNNQQPSVQTQNKPTDNAAKGNPEKAKTGTTAPVKAKK